MHVGREIRHEASDDISVAEAVRLKEKWHVSEIAAVTIGPGRRGENLRTPLAFGFDRGLHVREDGEVPLLTAAKAWAAPPKCENAQLTLLGTQAVNHDASHAGQMLAGLLEPPQARFASSVRIENHTETI